MKTLLFLTLFVFQQIWLKLAKRIVNQNRELMNRGTVRKTAWVSLASWKQFHNLQLKHSCLMNEEQPLETQQHVAVSEYTDVQERYLWLWQLYWICRAEQEIPPTWCLKPAINGSLWPKQLWKVFEHFNCVGFSIVVSRGLSVKGKSGTMLCWSPWALNFNIACH